MAGLNCSNKLFLSSTISFNIFNCIIIIDLVIWFLVKSRYWSCYKFLMASGITPDKLHPLNLSLASDWNVVMHNGKGR